MSTYVDSSVLLRLALGEPGALRARDLDPGVTSALTEVECLRTLDRLHVAGRLDAESVAERRAAVFDLMEALEVVELAPPVLRRASEPFPTPLGTLDALHLSTALLWRERHSRSHLAIATHDEALGRAARACGMDVEGLPS